MGRYLLLLMACTAMLFTACGKKKNSANNATAVVGVDCSTGLYRYDSINNVYRDANGQAVTCINGANSCASYRYDPYSRQYYNAHNQIVNCQPWVTANPNVYPFQGYTYNGAYINGCGYMNQFATRIGPIKYYVPVRIFNHNVCVERGYYNNHIHGQYNPVGYWGQPRYPVYNYSCLGGTAQSRYLGISLGICSGGGL